MSASYDPLSAVRVSDLALALARLNGLIPSAVSVSISSADWAASGDSYTLTIAQSVHKRQSGAYIAQIRHNVDGVLTEGTWAAEGTRTAYNSSTGDIVLTAPAAFDGTVTFI